MLQVFVFCNGTIRRIFVASVETLFFNGCLMVQGKVKRRTSKKKMLQAQKKKPSRIHVSQGRKVKLNVGDFGRIYQEVIFCK